MSGRLLCVFYGSSVQNAFRSLKLEYGFSDFSIGVLGVLGKGGVEKIVELELSNQSKERFGKSIAVVNEAIAMLKS